jgi:outer membrane protein TolC
MTKKIQFLIILCSIATVCFSQQKQEIFFTIDEVIQLAIKQSPDAMMAKHTFRSSYWEYRSFKAGLLPSLRMNATLPDLNRSISKITKPDGTDIFVDRRIANSSLNFNLSQNIGLTGGNIFITSGMDRIDLLGDSTITSYLSTPVRIGFSQPLFGFNSYKWEKKISPLKYKEAQKQYVDAIENVSYKAVQYFFDLIGAQMNLQISQSNYSNNDTLYNIAKGRYQIGTIAQNELLQLELAYMNSQTELKQARLDLEVSKFKLRSFLGFNDNVNINLIPPAKIPELQVDVSRALEEAKNNNPQMILNERQLIEAQRDVAKARADNLFNASLYASYGLTQTANRIADAYKKPQNEQLLQVGIQVPIIDWGQRRGRYKMAQSSQELINTTVKQNQIDFEQNVFLNVMQFNMQGEQLTIAARSDTIAKKRYEVTKQRFLIGKVDITNLNIAEKEKDVSKRAYISSLGNYWKYYYTIRQITLYDFEKKQPILQDFDELIK